MGDIFGREVQEEVERGKDLGNKRAWSLGISRIEIGMRDKMRSRYAGMKYHASVRHPRIDERNQEGAEGRNAR